MAEKTDKDIKRLKNIVTKVGEASKIKLDAFIKDFIMRPELSEINFPKTLTNMERAYVHFQAARNGLQSFSTGQGSERLLTLRRAPENTSLEGKLVTLTGNSITGVTNLLHSEQPRGHIANSGIHENHVTAGKKLASSRLSLGPFPKVPRPKRTNSFLEYRQRLPIWEHRDKIIELIKNHRVIFIKGSTGCGKTTQVGQFILDNAVEKSEKVRIICTVPRRIAAVSVSDRVALERGERLGQVVGYQIRLESCTSPTETLLTYCTSGILLRSLSPPDYKVLKNTTHIIIDEIHERDRQTDFLLTCLRDILPNFPDLRLIIMGADMNNELFLSYFRGDNSRECPIIQVEGRLHPVEIFYLEDVLDILKYENYDMRCTRREDDEDDVYKRLVQKLCNTNIGSANRIVETKEDKIELTSDLMTAVDDMIKNVWTDEDEVSLVNFLHMVQSKGVPVNYQHSIVGVTMLMAASVRGLKDYVSTLLTLGADPAGIKSRGPDYEFSAIDWASDYHQHEILKLLMEHQYETKLLPAKEQSMDANKSQRLARYLQSIDEERVDLLLILRLLHMIHTNADPSHAVLIFLPGYDEIVTLKHLILTDSQLGFRHGSFLIFMLHSNIQTGDQRAAFDKPPKGMRKILLSTNIAESSLTFEDIVYVIDSGKAKEKSFDSLTCVTQLKSVWISKASVNQRRGRAGRCRPGICYHLFSSARYESMSEFPIPEIVRTSLQELCLQARSFMKPDITIEHFFTRIPEPPAPIAVKKSVELLTIMGALDKNQQLTNLGSHLLDFPLEPFLGKSLIYAIVFRCLDPILTLVSVISYRDPFQLPSDPKDKQKAQEAKAEFSRNSFSDHMAYLKAFQDWEKSKMFDELTERRFCRDNYLSSVTFEMVYAVRSQLIGQLRASGFVTSKGPADTKELNVNSSNWALVKGVLVATLYPNICGVDRAKKALYNGFNSKVALHPSTTVVKKKNAIEDLPTDWVIFDEMTQQGYANLVKGCTCVSTVAIALFAGSFTPIKHDDLEHDDHYSLIKINQWITLKGTKDVIDLLICLRQKISHLVLKRLEAPSAQFNVHEENTIQTIAALLVSEDRALGFQNINGIEQWPKLVAGNIMAAPKKGYEKTSQTYKSSGDSRNYRYFVVEVGSPFCVKEIAKNRVWLIPEWLKDKFLKNGRAERSLDHDTIIFFWHATSKHFVGAMKLKGTIRFSFISEVPIEIISTKYISFQNAEHEVGFKHNVDLPMNGLELEVDFGAPLLNMFKRNFRFGAK